MTGVAVSFAALAACSSSDSNGIQASETAQNTAESRAQMGKSCFGACGSGTAQKCAVSADECANKLCIVAPSSVAGSSAPLAYCTVGCGSEECGAGYHCESIKDFTSTTGGRACVADAENCGNGVVELGETCDGAKEGRDCAADCKSFVARCGDKIIEGEEECDGNTDEQWCSSECKKLAPMLRLTGISMKWNYADSGSETIISNGSAGGDLPVTGDSKGCGSVIPKEITQDYVRYEWKHCKSDGLTALLSFAVPRTEVSYYRSDSFPASVLPTLTIERGNKRNVFSGSSLSNIPNSSELSSYTDGSNYMAIGKFEFDFWKAGFGDGGTVQITANYATVVPHKL